MINLIPPAAKKSMKREYWLRVSVVWLLLLMAVCVVAALLAVPSLVLVQTQLRAYESQLQSATQAAAQQDALTEEVRRANTQATAVLALSEVATIHSYSERIRSLQGGAIELRQITANRADDTAVSSITVTGTADTRTALTGFSAALINDPLFSEADVPLSNVAANEDIAFTIRVIIAPPQ